MMKGNLSQKLFLSVRDAYRMKHDCILFIFLL